MKSTIPCGMSSVAALLFGVVVITGCYYGRLSVQTMVPCIALADSAMVVQLPKVDVRYIHGQKIGTVSYKQGDFDLPWTHDRLADYLRRTALQHGANLVKITYYQRPWKSTREEFSADLYRVGDARDYTDEEVIEWSGDRKLTFDDFKYHGRIYSDTLIVLSNGSDDFDIVARFHCEHSWINRASKDSAEVLLHEQGNFDLSEIYCRQYLDRIRESNAREPFGGHVFAAWKAKQAQYESETAGGLDYGRQAEWTAKIHHALVYGAAAFQ